MVMKRLSFLLIFVFIFGFSQNKKVQVKKIQSFQKELNKEYLNSETSPLRGDNFTNFKAHPFFPVNLNYRVKAKLVKTPDAKVFDLPTSSGKSKKYREYAKAIFTIDGKEYTLSLYQSLDLMKRPEYADYLFLPFRDATNEKETYGGGKYLDLTIPKGNTIIIDFNQSYHPYCAYNAFDYNCPIVPKENWLEIPINAGVMYEDVYHH